MAVSIAVISALAALGSRIAHGTERRGRCDADRGGPHGRCERYAQDRQGRSGDDAPDVAVRRTGAQAYPAADWRRGERPPVWGMPGCSRMNDWTIGSGSA